MTGRLALIFPLLLEAVALTDSVTVKPGVANDIKKSVKVNVVRAGQRPVLCAAPCILVSVVVTQCRLNIDSQRRDRLKALPQW